MKATNHQNVYETFNVVWRGINLEIRHKENWVAGFDHIEVINKDRVMLPITETGYRSLFILPERISEYGTPVEYVITWLDHEAQSESWKRLEAEKCQLSLF